MSYTVERWQGKADAWAGGWLDRFGTLPTIHAVVFGISQAQFETGDGDYWPGPDGLVETADDENNWGACNLRRCSPTELAVIAAAGVTPGVGPDHEKRAKAAMAALAAAGMPVASGEVAGIVVPRATIHCDSAPGLGPYFVWFANFDTPRAGAAYHVHVLAEGKPARAVLENPAGNEYALAAAMYSRGYFTGVHNPKAWYLKGHEVPAGTPDAITGSEANIQAYAAGVAVWTPQVRAALIGWTPEIGPIPTTPPPVPPFNLSQARDVQRALNALGCGRPLLDPDGNPGDITTAAIGFYAGGTLAPDGVSPLDVIPYEKGTKTLAEAVRNAMARDLRAMNFEVIQ